MPAAYAHDRFGEACIQMMPEKLQDVCLKYREIFDFGVHGPDILFYYDPLTKNEVNQYGGALHRKTGKEFFAGAKEVYKKGAHKGAMAAYLMGFLAHFTLDSCCHGYINRMPDEIHISHNRIESQFEVYLMEKEHMNPMYYDRSEVLCPTRQNAEVIAGFFPFTAAQIEKSLKGQKRTLRLFYSPRQIKKRMLRKMIRTFHIPGDFQDLFLDKEELMLCHKTNREIYGMYEEAIDRYPALLKNLMRYLYDKEELGSYFEHDFEGN